MALSIQANWPKKGQRGWQKVEFTQISHDKDICGKGYRLCPDCKLISSREYRIKNKYKYDRSNKEGNWKKSKVKNSEGGPFTALDFDRSYQIQQGKCKICWKHQSELTLPLQVDHCHKTKVFRGLLCHNCNVSLGFFKDSIEFLESAIQYLRGGTLPSQPQ